MMVNHAMRVALVSLLLLCAGVGVQAEEPKRDAAAYKSALKSLEANLAKGKCAACRTRLDRLLKTHEGAPYIQGGIAELEDLVRRIAFGVKYPPKDPQSVVSGKIESYRPDTGAIKITYTNKTAQDWRRQRDYYFSHPARFAGPFSIEIKGGAFPHETDDCPQVVFGHEEGGKHGKLQSWQILCGTPVDNHSASQTWLPVSISHYDGDKRTKLFEKETTPAKAGLPYTISVKVKKTRIEAKLNGKSIGKVKKEKGIFGYVSFEAKGWYRLTLQGVIEPGWIQAKLDALSAKDREAFRSTFTPEDHLPEWVYEEPDEEEREDQVPMPDWPSGISASNDDDFREVARLLLWGKFPDALERLDELGKSDFPKGALEFLRGYTHLVQYRLADACRALARSMKADPEFGRAQLLHAIATLLRGDEAKARKELEAVYNAFEPDEALYRRLSGVLLRQGRLPAVQAVMKTAREHGVKSDAMDQFAKVVLKAEKGPDWARSAEYKTASYHVMTDMNKEIARESGQMLERMFQLYQSSFDFVKRDTTRHFKVYLFRGRSGFLWYMGDLSTLWGGGGEQAAGVYSPMLKQLLIWNQPSKDDMFSTVRHEGFHQYLDRVMPNAPRWLDEGLAVYYENTANDGGRLKTGQIPKEYIRLLEEEEPLPLKRFFALTAAEFYERGHPSYAQAWSLVHLLLEGDTKYRKLFKALVRALDKGSTKSAMATVFTDDVMDSLELAVERHLMKLDDD
ncbi:MAG: DUF1570 domain-containing protein [bacterium]|nr:DUF1570 domain-containing protein [bacterium]